jgi:nucleolar complex protein 3
LTKPARTHADHDDLPSIASHDDDQELWDSDLGKDSGLEDDPQGDSDLESDGSGSDGLVSSDAEQTYERQPRPKNKLFDADIVQGSERLPVKLPDGTLRKRGHLPAPAPEELSDSDPSDGDASSSAPRPDPHAGSVVEDVSTGARFGRPAVVTIIGARSRKARIQGAKEQLAGICQEVLADPENSVSRLLSRI